MSGWFLEIKQKNIEMCVMYLFAITIPPGWLFKKGELLRIVCLCSPNAFYGAVMVRSDYKFGKLGSGKVG